MDRWTHLPDDPGRLGDWDWETGLHSLCTLVGCGADPDRNRRSAPGTDKVTPDYTPLNYTPYNTLHYTIGYLKSRAAEEISGNIQ